MCPASLHRLRRQLPLIVIDPGATGVTLLTLLEWWGLDVRVQALVVVDVAAVHTLHMQRTIFIQLNSLGVASQGVFILLTPH